MKKPLDSRTSSRRVLNDIEAPEVNRGRLALSYDDETDEFDDEKSTLETSDSVSSDDTRPGQLYFIVAATVVGSAFLGVFMKFAFGPSHSGHAHATSKYSRRVVVDVDNRPVGVATPLKPLVVAVPEVISITNATSTTEIMRKTTFTYECRTDACLWQSRLVYDKFNQSVGPCDDFYAYVCSSRWYGDIEVQNRPYSVSAPGLLILDIAKYLLNYRDKEDTPQNFITHSSMFLKTCIQPKNLTTKPAAWTSIKHLFSTFSLSPWPLQSDPVTYTLQDVLRAVDKTLGLFPIVDVSLRKRFENEGYLLHLDAPKLIIVRHQVTYLQDGFEEYKNYIKRAFTLWDNITSASHLADDMVAFERKLEEASVPQRKFVSILNSTVPIMSIKRVGKFEWDAYLTYLHPGSDKVVLVNSAYISRLSSILTSTSLSTLLNYIGFRIIVLLAPLLPKEAEFLMPLSYDRHIMKYNSRLQACMHLAEHMFPYGMRRIARNSMGKTSLEQVLYDHNLNALIVNVKASMQQAVARAPWLTQSEADLATQKIENLEVEFMGAKEHTDTVARYYDGGITVALTVDTILRDYVTLVNQSMYLYWASKDNADFDARHHISSLRPGYEYNAGRNHLYLPFGVLASQNRISQSTIPAIILPYIVTYVLQGMFEAVDIRGSTINVRGMPESWWSQESVTRYRKLQRCFVDTHLDHLKRLGTLQEAPLSPFLRSLMSENAALTPMYEAYVRALVAPHSMQRNFRVPGLPDLTPDMLFFINLAAAQCETTLASGILSRRLVQYGIALPASLKVNLALRNFDKFSEVFFCSKGSYMNPPERCPLW
ncbi:neprilysin-1-like [Ornithodoros turicata]|uniref:neprilysin-1-like n=1 Tax=Ornithodoros turicata TaxID=34597 RepID=UPI003138D1D5